MSDAIERQKTYEDGVRDGFIKGMEEANRIIEQMLHTACNTIVYAMPETEAVKLLQEQIQKLKCCGNCKYHSFWGDELKCNYGLIEALIQDKLVECKNMDKWEME